MEYILNQVPLFMIVFLRFSGFMAFIPFFKNRGFSTVVKAAFSFMIAFLIFPTLNTQSWTIPQEILGFILFIAGEVLVGIMMGLVVLIVLFILELIGQMIGFQMAFSMARAVDATTGSNTNVIGVILMMVGTMLLLIMGGDHYIINAGKESFAVIPPGKIVMTKDAIMNILSMITHSFELGFKIASPAIVVLLCVDITLGIIGKTSSKMQIFFVGLPLKISIGLFSITIVLGFLRLFWTEKVAVLPETFFNLFKVMRI